MKLNADDKLARELAMDESQRLRWFEALVFLQGLDGIGKANIHKNFLDVVKNARDIRKVADAAAFYKSISDDEIDAALKKAASAVSMVKDMPDISVITIFDNAFPQRLRIMGSSCPLLLYVKGNKEALKKTGVAVIGTRYPTPWSEELEKRLVKKILDISDVSIVSGLALGCDRVAHETALDNTRETVAVMPSGVNEITPAVHEKLAEDIILHGGCLLSEYAPKETATKYTFIERDGVVAAMASAVLVIQCGIESGTMHTVEFAEKYHTALGCYEGESSKGDYSGNRYILDHKNAFTVRDEHQVDEFLSIMKSTIDHASSDSSPHQDIPHQMTLVDYFQ